MEYTIPFFALFFVDFVFARYIKAVNDVQPIKAGMLASIITLLNIVAVISYTENHLMIIPAVLGAFVGSFVGVKMSQVDSR